RVVVIDDQGRVVDFDKFLVFLAREIVEVTGIRRIVTTVDASMLVERVLTNVEVVRTRVGDVFVAHALGEQPSAFGGEPCGAYLFPSHGLWPDGVYAIFKILELLERKGKPLSELLDALPTYCTIREKFLCQPEQKQAAMELIKQRLPKARSINTIDGIRADYGSHVVLIRPSGTEGLIRCNLEAHSRELIEQQRPHFARLITEAIEVASYA
ncbi:phosphoglucosamine mutase, partial [Acidobacteria bacterium AH-259-A15]|nr:phosphoglucosamine mutase [Acidobacteria bacterium AH-259-A15]